MSQKKKLGIDTSFVVISLLLIFLASTLSRNEATTFTTILWGLAFLIGGFSKMVEGFKKTIEEKSLNVEFLMIAAASAAFITGDYGEGAILIFIFALSGVLEEYTMAKSEKALTSLLSLTPKTAILIKDNKEIEIAIEELQIGDVVSVKVGQQVPGDGEVISGSTFINQSAITGEFVPVAKDVGSLVFAGGINVDAPILVRLVKDPKDSVVQKIIDFVSHAQQTKTKRETFIDKFEKGYVYVVVLIALGFMFVPLAFGATFADTFKRGLIVLVVASPCALVASISPAILSALSNAAHKGILIKSGSTVEGLKNLKTIVFDKTGTLTQGKPIVAKLMVVPAFDKELVTQLLVSLENKSSHPLAKAISEHFKEVKPIELEIKEIAGRGLETMYQDQKWQIGRFDFQEDPSLSESVKQCLELGHTIVWIIVDGVGIGYVALKDTLREGVKDVMTSLSKLGVNTVLMTGDNHQTATAIALESGITSVESDCFPETKVDHVKALQKQYGEVMMIGDGINDAPSLAIADIGVAMGAGTDVSLETSDIIFMNNRLENVEYSIRLSKKMNKVVTQNIVFSLSVIAVLMSINVFGYLELPTGVVAHEMSTILVILNSLRLLIPIKY